MELNKILKLKNPIKLIEKYKYVLLVLLIGLAFMLIPTGSDEKNTNTDQTIKTEENETFTDQLKDLLSKIDGAGCVDVLLSKGEGEETIYQINADISQSDGNITERSSTVTVTDESRSQRGLIKQVNPPEYRGAIIICEGADSPMVQLAIKEAVSKVTGLGIDRISVLKMKQ